MPCSRKCDHPGRLNISPSEISGAKPSSQVLHWHHPHLGCGHDVSVRAVLSLKRDIILPDGFTYRGFAMNPAGLYATRFFLGVTEAGLFPGMA